MKLTFPDVEPRVLSFQLSCQHKAFSSCGACSFQVQIGAAFFDRSICKKDLICLFTFVFQIFLGPELLLKTASVVACLLYTSDAADE